MYPANKSLFAVIIPSAAFRTGQNNKCGPKIDQIDKQELPNELS